MVPVDSLEDRLHVAGKLIVIVGSYQNWRYIFGPSGSGTWHLNLTAMGRSLHSDLLLNPQSSSSSVVQHNASLGTLTHQHSSGAFGLTGPLQDNFIAQEGAAASDIAIASEKETYRCLWSGCERRKLYTKKGHYDNHIEKHYNNLARQQYHGAHLEVFANSGLVGADDDSGVPDQMNT